MDSERYGERPYSAVGEEGVALLDQNGLNHGRIIDAQDRLTAVKYSVGENSARECEHDELVKESQTTYRKRHTPKFSRISWRTHRQN